ncbi:MAG TPA: hypothetical protein VNV66_19985 [Pilimelia sp.]|nr:hypothetical protein [Pilimelia sp.]
MPEPRNVLISRVDAALADRPGAGAFVDPDAATGAADAAGDPDVLVVGDLNAYAGEDPVAALVCAGYTNLVARYGGAGAYSYVFDGQWGALEHAQASLYAPDRFRSSDHDPVLVGLALRAAPARPSRANRSPSG